MGKTLTFGELDAESRKIGAWLQSTGLAKGDRVAVMMPNILQNPVIVYGILRAGFAVVNVNPLYTPRELEHQLKDSGAKAIFVLENFAHTVEQVAARTDLKHIVVATMGDMLGLKGLIVNFVVRKVKKLVPAWSLPGHHVHSRRFWRRAAANAEQGRRQAERHRVPAIYRRHDGRLQGRDADPSQSSCRTWPRWASGWKRPSCNKKRPDHLVFLCALPLYHIFALTVNSLMGLSTGGAEHPDPQSARYPGLRQGTRQVQGQYLPRAQHAVQRPDEQCRVSRSSIFPIWR